MRKDNVSIPAKLLSHKPGPWRWGVWTHRPDLQKEMPNSIPPGGVKFPFYEFKQEYNGKDLVLSTEDYGMVLELEQRDNILESTSIWYGGETTILVTHDCRDIIAAAPDMLEDLKTALSAARRNYAWDVKYTDFTARLHFHDEIEDLKEAIAKAEGK